MGMLVGMATFSGSFCIRIVKWWWFVDSHNPAISRIS